MDNQPEQNQNCPNYKNESSQEIDFNTDNLLRQFLQSARKGDKELFLELLAKIIVLNSSLINYKDEQGQTALHYAADEGNLKIVEIIIKSNADLNSRSNIKRTPLHISCNHGYFDISKLLIENGALINVQDNERNTPIHLCVLANHIELLKYLLERCPQADVKNIYNKTPLELATSNEIKGMLLEYLSKNESKYHKIKIHNVNTNMAISMLTGLNSNNSNVNSVHNNSNTSSTIKGVLFSGNNSKKKNLHTHSNTNITTMNQKLRKFPSNLHSTNNNIHTTHTDITNGSNNNNININISANMCNVLNLSGQKSKKIFNTNKFNSNCGSSNNTKTSIAIEAKVASPKLVKKSVSKQIFQNKKYSNSKGFGYNTNITSVNHFLSPEKKNKAYYNSNNNTVFSKAKSKPNFFSSESKRKFDTANKRKSINNNQTLNSAGGGVKSSKNSGVSKTAMKLASTNNFFQSSKGFTSAKKAKQTHNIIIKKTSNFDSTQKKIANVEINLNDVSSTSNNSQSNLNSTINENNNTNNNNNIDGNNSLSCSQDTASEDRISPDMFTCLALLGRGSFGSVYLVEKKNSKMLYAMKVLNKNLIMNQNIVKYAMTERNVLSITSHPFIVKLNYAFQTNDKLFLILDYCPGGDLAEHLLKEKRFKEQRAKIYLCEVILALGDLHKHDIIFRDLKPDNVVLDAKGHALLTDFGLSKEGVYDGNITKSFCGSIAYLAPEMLKRKGHGKAVDWYLLGVLFYEMLVGIPPYFTDNQEMIFKNIEKGDLQIPKFVSDKAKTLLKALLKKEPEERLGSKNDVEEIKAHEYFRDINWNDVYDRKLSPPIPQQKITKNKHIDIDKILKEEDQIDCDLSENNNFGDINNNNTLFNGWTFIQNDLPEQNGKK